ncbi:MAG: hypothetical protein LAN71_10745 [Acidobacteriia bacterium]|nr:hypothetical protein [Terriglobia bacterium]
MRLPTFAFILLFFTSLLAGAARTLQAPPAGAQTPPPVAASESHNGLTISAVPWTKSETYKPKFPKKNPLSSGIIAIHTIFQNDTAETIRVNIEQIRLLVTLRDDSRQSLEPLSPDDVATIMLKGKMKDPSRRGPLPLRNNGKDWTDLQTRASDAGITSSMVPPHGKLEGLLYFDLAGQFELLDTARLYIPEVTIVEQGRPLLYFELEFAHSARQ